MTTPHSPTQSRPKPWKFDATTDGIRILDARGDVVCHMAGPRPCDGRSADDILRCVNAHDALVAACRALVGALGAHGPCKNNNCRECKAAWTKGHDAIRKAEA